MRKLSAKWAPKCLNADKKCKRCQSSEQVLDFFRRDPNDFLSRLVTVDETWLYHYDPETKQQSMKWRHSGLPLPKNSECKNPLEKFSPRFFVGQDGFLVDYLPKGQTINAEFYLSLLVQLKDILKKNAAGRSPKGSCSCTTMPRLTGHCIPEEIGLPGLPVSWSPTLFSGSGPVGLPPFPWTEKKNWKVAIFRPTRRSLLSRRPVWTDNLLNFFWVTCKC